MSSRKSKTTKKDNDKLKKLILAMLIGASAGAYIAYSKPPSYVGYRSRHLGKMRGTQPLITPPASAYRSQRENSGNIEMEEESSQEDVKMNFEDFKSELLTLRNPGVKNLTLEGETKNALGGT